MNNAQSATAFEIASSLKTRSFREEACRNAAHQMFTLKGRKTGCLLTVVIYKDDDHAKLACTNQYGVQLWENSFHFATPIAVVDAMFEAAMTLLR